MRRGGSLLDREVGDLPHNALRVGGITIALSQTKYYLD